MRFVFPISTSAVAAVTVVSAASLLLVRRFQKKKNKEKHKKTLRNERPVKAILTDESTDQEMAPPRPSTGKSKKRRRKRNYASPRPSEVEETEPLPVIPVPPVEEAKSPFLIRALRDIHQKLTNISRSLSIRVRQWTILSDTEWSISDEEQAEGAEELSEPEDSGILVKKSEAEDDTSLTVIPSTSVSDSRSSSKTQLEHTASATTSSYEATSSQKPSTATPRRTLSDLEESWSECITGSTEGSESDEVFHDAETSEVLVPLQQHPKVTVVSVVEEKNDIKKAAEEIKTREEKLLTEFEEVLQLQQTKVWEAKKESSPDIPVFDWERELVMELERLSSEKIKQAEISESLSKTLETTIKEVQEPSVEVKIEKEFEKSQQRKLEIPNTEEITKLETVEEEVTPKEEDFTKKIAKDDSTQSQKNVPETYQMLIEAEEAIQSSNSVSIRGVEEVIEEEPEESEEDLPLICLDSESDLNSRGSSSPMSDVVFEQQKPLLHSEDEKNKLADLEDDPDYKELLDQESDYNRQQLEAVNDISPAIADDSIEQFGESKLIETVHMAEVTGDELISEAEMDVQKTEVPEFIDKTIGSWSEEVITEGIVQAAKLIADKVVEMDEKQDSESLTELFSQELAKRILVESFPEASVQIQTNQSSGSTELDRSTCRFQDFVTKLSEEIARIAVAETIATAKLRKEITIQEYEKEFGTRIIDEIFNQIFNKTFVKEKERCEVSTDLEELPLEDQTTIDLKEVSLTEKEEGVMEPIIQEEKKELEKLSLQNQKDIKKKEVFKPDSKEAVLEKEDGIVSWLHKRTDSLLQQEKPTRQFHAMKKLSLSQIPKPVSSTIRGKSPQQQRRVSEPPEPKKRLSLQSNQPSADLSVTRRQSAPAKHIQPLNRITETVKKPTDKPERTKSPVSILKTRSVDVPSHFVSKPSIPPRRSLQVTPRERKHGVFGIPVQPSPAELSQSKGKQVPQVPSRPPPQPPTRPTAPRKKSDSKVMQPRKSVPTTKPQPKHTAVLQPRLRQSTEAFVTLATNDSYALGALVLAKSLRVIKTTRHLVILTTDGISPYMRQLLTKVFDVVINVTRIEFSGAALELLDRPELGVTLTKLHCWKLTQYKKCVFLDADLLVLQNCDELFERAELSAAPDVGWPDCFNSGVFVFVPSLDTYWGLVNLFKEKGSFDGGDQGLLNWYFGNNWKSNIGKRLPFIYNVVATSTYTYAPAFQRFGEGAKIVHFLGATKPWHVNWSTESRYILEDSKINRTFLPYMQKWLNIFFDEVFPQLPKVYKDRLHHKHSTSVKDLTSRSNIMDVSPQPSPHTPRSSHSSTSSQRSPHTISATPYQTEHIHHEEHPPEVIHHYQSPSESPKETDNLLSLSFTSLEVHGSDSMENRSELTARSDSQRSYISGMSTPSEQQVASAATESTDFAHDYREESPRLPSESTEDRQDSSVDYSSSLFQDEDLEELEEPETEEVRQAAWEEYKMDYLGKDRFDNILRHLDTMMGVEPLENESTDIPDEDKESEKYENESIISGSDTSSQNPGSMQTPEPSFATTADYKRMHEWEQGRIDYTGRDSSDNIMRRLDFLLCNDDNPFNSK